MKKKPTSAKTTKPKIPITSGPATRTASTKKNTTSPRAGKKDIAPKTGDDSVKKKTVFFPIVAIGASAGGIEAITELFKNLDPNLGMAFVYIQHLDPNHESLLSTILSHHTLMKVYEAEEKMKIEPDCIYVIPPNTEMFIVDGVLKLNPRPAPPALSLPINRFFISLAEKQQKRAIGILLSGSGSDGAFGLKAIKSMGGITFAQDKSAKFQSMPNAAIAEDAVDMVMPPAEIAHELKRLSESKDLLFSLLDGDADLLPEVRGTEISNILLLLRQVKDVDFTSYKRGTIQRRIVRRMLLHRLASLQEYLAYLKKNTQEVELLFNDLLINVTSFFRDQELSVYLTSELLPLIINANDKNELRIWIPACSSGEEAYSIAMMVCEVLGEKESVLPVHIFATDLSESSIAKARLGLYSKANVENVSESRLKRFFIKADSQYRIVKSIRDMCVFAQHNVFKDPPFSRMDLISCCNLLIYLEPVLQKKILSTFHYALNPGGFLILGKSESIGTGSALFSLLQRRLKIYTSKKEKKEKGVFELASRKETSDYIPFPTSRSFPKKPDPSTLGDKVDELLMSQYMPASVLVNSDMEILQFRGSTGIYLEPASGKASLNLLKMARTGLNFELRNAVHSAAHSGKQVKKSNIEIKYKRQSH